MTESFLEHVNITVSDPVKTAERLCNFFDWKVRWQGSAIHDGYTVHVGSKNSYIALYAQSGAQTQPEDSYKMRGGFNHVAVVVEDLDNVEKKILEAGFLTTNHGNYEPGRRFYFRDGDNIEFEVVSYP